MVHNVPPVNKTYLCKLLNVCLTTWFLSCNGQNRFNTGGEEVIEREFSFETQVVRE